MREPNLKKAYRHKGPNGGEEKKPAGGGGGHQQKFKAGGATAEDEDMEYQPNMFQTNMYIKEQR